MILFTPLIVNGQAGIDSLNSELRANHEDSIQYARILIELATEFRPINPDSSLYYGQKAVVLCQANNYEALLTPALNTVASAFSVKGMYDTSLVVIFRAIEHGKTQSIKIPLINAYNNLAIDYYYRDDLNEAKRYFELSHQVALAENHPKEAANALQNIGLVSGVQGFVEEEISNYKEARLVFEALDFKEGIANIDMNLGTVYVAQENYELGLKSFKNAQNIFSSLNHRTSLSVIHTNLAGTYMKLGDLERAEKNALASIQISQELKQKNEEKYTTELLSKIYKEKGDLNKAYLTLKQYQILKDSIFNEEKVMQIEKLKIEFDTEQKEAEIVLLNTSSQLKDQQIRQQNFFIAAIAVGGFLILLLTIVLFNRYKLKNRLLKVLHEKNLIISSALSEKETLLKEIHHRVKNNLQIIESLLSLQDATKGNRKPEELLKISQDRIHAISSIHDKLYRSENLKEIDFKNYVEELLVHFKSTYDSESVNFKSSIEAVNLDLDQLIPCGLILNELITNSLKYAFEKSEDKTIEISGSKGNEGSYQLEISDNGIGFCSDHQNTSSIGLQLVDSLVDQLDGVIERVEKVGTSYRISFTV